MNKVRALAQRFSGIGGSLAFGVIAFLYATALDKYHPFRFSREDLIAGGAYAVFVVAILQIVARTQRPLQSYLLCAAGAALLFWLTCWSAFFDNADGRYSPAIALLIWGGITLGVFVWVIYWEQTEPRNTHG